jgi:hypothetical protein
VSLPWVSRAAYQALEDRLKWTEQQLREAEAKAAQAKAAADHLDEERRTLVDRILTSSGQAPLYGPASTPAAVVSIEAKPVDVKDLAKADLLPAAGVTFRGVHAAARRAMAEGKFDVQAAVPRR